MKRQRVIAGGCAALAALRIPPAGAQARPPLAIKVGISPIESYGEALYAQAEGFFHDAGLQAEAVTLPGGGAPMTLAVISGTLDASIANIGSVTSAHAHGLGVYLLAACGLYTSANPTTVLATAKESPIRTARDLEGKTIGVTSLGDLQQAAVMHWLDTQGANAKNVTVVEVSTSQMLGALNANRIAAGVVVEPTLTAIRNDIRILALPYDSVAPQLAISGWIVNRAWFEANPDAAQRLIAVIRTTAHWANRNQAATASVLAEHTKIAPDLLSTMRRVTYAEERSFAVIQPVIDVMATYGFLTQPFGAAELFPPNLRHPGPI